MDSLRVEHSGDGVNFTTRILGEKDAIGDFYTGDDMISLEQPYLRESSIHLRNGFIEPFVLLALVTDMTVGEEQ
jgi:hypothetical protein